ncbi:MAG: hypothetical protein QF365_05615 [Candidatus Thalassarchaeaceae archaeon]|nr:hypothetical protein [Candidatus Thalassarchaeaceae archaeon]HJM29990.1 hypothetical protein [Candidatus Thalassarchaeaceae archaeon]
MASDSDLDKFQRWMQNSLDEASLIEDASERDRVIKRLQNAIQVCIEFRSILELSSMVSDPFVSRESPVRIISEESIKTPISIDGKCNKCGAEMAGDLEFCPLCGAYE